MAATSVSLPTPNKKGAEYAAPLLLSFEEVPHLVGASAQAKASSLCSTFNHVQPKSMIPARPKK
jgi:hypothetical protein